MASDIGLTGFTFLAKSHSEHFSACLMELQEMHLEEGSVTKYILGFCMGGCFESDPMTIFAGDAIFDESSLTNVQGYLCLRYILDIGDSPGNHYHNEDGMYYFVVKDKDKTITKIPMYLLQEAIFADDDGKHAYDYNFCNAPVVPTAGYSYTQPIGELAKLSNYNPPAGTLLN